jgi:ketol-acid reductoisomerase
MNTAPIRSFNPRSPSTASSRSQQLHGSNVFPVRNLDFKAGPSEVVVIGGRDKFNLVAKAFDDAGIKQILFVGWGSQGPAQAQNLRDTLNVIGREDIKVCVGLRPDSTSIPKAKAAGFSDEDGTLGDPYALAGKSDLIILLVADGGLVHIYHDLLAAAKRGAIIGISHGFIVGHTQSIGEKFAAAHDLIMVAPKGMGPSVRALYVQGIEKEGAGINSSVAVRVNDPSRYDLVRDIANAWSVGIGSPVTFGTDFIDEVTSDLFGERAVLLGALWGISQAMYRYFRPNHSEHESFQLAVSGLTGTVTKQLSKLGIQGFCESLTPIQERRFDRGYAISYPVCDEVHGIIYNNVADFTEISDVVAATRQLSANPMLSVETHGMWKAANEGGWYGEEVPMSDELAFTAGIYVGCMMSQLHTLLHHGHRLSETFNESLIEAIDSLTPYMHSRGVAFMIDNCSTTARLGARRYGPLYEERLLKVLMDISLRPSDTDQSHILKTLEDTALHHDIGVCFDLRPLVSIEVPLVAMTA